MSFYSSADFFPPNMCLISSTELWNFLFKEVQVSPFLSGLWHCQMIAVDGAGLSPLPQLCLQHWGSRTGWKQGALYPLLVVAIANVPSFRAKKSSWLEIVWPFPLVFQPLSFFSLLFPIFFPNNWEIWTGMFLLRAFIICPWREGNTKN